MTCTDPAPRTWLVVAAHADDEAKAVPVLLTDREPGDRVVILVMRLCGEGQPYDRDAWTAEEAVAIRRTHMEEAARDLHAELRWWIPPAPGLEPVRATAAEAARLAALLEELRPQRLITHWGEDSHPDHVGTCRLVEQALAQVRIAGESWLLHFGQPGRELEQPGFVPNHYVDISPHQVLARAIWARLVHRSQTDLFLLQQYLRYYWEHGRRCGVRYAAGYRSRRIVDGVWMDPHEPRNRDAEGGRTEAVHSTGSR